MKCEFLDSQCVKFLCKKMAVVLKGEQQTDGSFVFAASSEQVNSLNKMCDGNLNTQLSDVQFGMTNTGVAPKVYVKGSITLPLWITTYDSNYKEFRFPNPTEKVIVAIDGNYSSLSDLLQYITNHM